MKGIKTATKGAAYPVLTQATTYGSILSSSAFLLSASAVARLNAQTSAYINQLI
jgi:hypothetical protein